MSNSRAVTFNEALELVESLPGTLQDELIELIRRRRLETRREALIASVAEARRELARGDVRRGTVGDLLKVLSE